MPLRFTVANPALARNLGGPHRSISNLRDVHQTNELGNGDEPSWLPDVNTCEHKTSCRSGWIYELSLGQLKRAGKLGLNV
jgi:hypothetical protein